MHYACQWPGETQIDSALWDSLVLGVERYSDSQNIESAKLHGRLQEHRPGEFYLRNLEKSSQGLACVNWVLKDV